MDTTISPERSRKTITRDILKLIEKTISDRESAAFDETVEALAAEGWNDPVLQAQNEWQGHDNCIVFDDFAEVLADLAQYDQVPIGCNDFQEEDDDDEDEDAIAEAQRLHLISELTSAGQIGTGEPLAFIGIEGYFTLIREGATADEIEQVTLQCFPDDYYDDDSDNDD